MIWMTFECPTTGQPLRSMQASEWSSEMTEALIAMHCPKCSQLHTFARDQAILEMRRGGDRVRTTA